MIDAQGQIDHFHGFGNDFGTAAEAREKMADVAVVLLDGESQVFAGEELVFGDETVKAVPVVGEDGLALEADFIEELLTEPAPAKALGSVQKRLCTLGLQRSGGLFARSGFMIVVPARLASLSRRRPGRVRYGTKPWPVWGSSP